MLSVIKMTNEKVEDLFSDKMDVLMTKKVLIIIQAYKPQRSNRKVDSGRRLFDYYKERYGEYSWKGKGGLGIFPIKTDKERKRVQRIIKQFYPHVKVYRLYDLTAKGVLEGRFE